MEEGEREDPSCELSPTSNVKLLFECWYTLISVYLSLLVSTSLSTVSPYWRLLKYQSAAVDAVNSLPRRRMWPRRG